MKSIFDAATRNELAGRINAVTAQNTAQWGKMNVAQMLKHCAMCDDMFHGELKIKRVFIGRLLGPMILKKILKNDKPIGRNAPTSPVLKSSITNEETELQKTEWLKRIVRYENYNHTGFVHPFFGPMTREQIGLLAYKHADHHLRQFGA